MNGMGASVVEDGMIGLASIQALAGLSQVEVYRQFKQGRIRYYESLAQKYPKFLHGWLNRVNSFPDL
jgi:type VI secretion system secreted protein VgrG